MKPTQSVAKSQPNQDTEPSSRAILIEMNLRDLQPQTGILGFGHLHERQRQEIWLLDCILRLTRPISRMKQNTLSQLIEWDSQIRGFLQVIMEEESELSTAPDTPIAFAVR
jgi:hypothetical protein